MSGTSVRPVCLPARDHSVSPCRSKISSPIAPSSQLAPSSRQLPLQQAAEAEQVLHRRLDLDPARHPGARDVHRRSATDHLQAAINRAHKENKLHHPINIRKPAEARGRTRWLTRTEVARLLWAAWRTNRHVARFILVALYTGTRHSAVPGLRWEPNGESGWVNLERGLIYRLGNDEAQSKKRRTPSPSPANSPRTCAAGACRRSPT